MFQHLPSSPPHSLPSPSSPPHQGLYHEGYPNVGVMFASIPNFFKDFYAETSVNNGGIECMRVLNEIIADFDELLEKPKFNSSK